MGRIKNLTIGSNLMLVQDSNGLQVRIECIDAYEYDHVFASEAIYLVDGGDVSDTELEYINTKYADLIHQEWAERQMEAAEYFEER